MKNGQAYSHQCAAPDCKNFVPSQVLMCYPHWRMVPRALQRGVSATWQAFQRNPFDGAAREAYNQVRDAAIAAVATRLAK